MKLNMWLIGEKLEKYHPRFEISDGASRITGVRMWSDADTFVPDDQFVYVRHTPRSSILSCGRDSIVLPPAEPDVLLNDLLSIFEACNAWETALWETSAQHSLQQAVDLADQMLGNPILLSDSRGNVLAMSSAYRDAPISAYWAEAQRTRLMPIPTVGSRLLTTEGQPGSWTPEPQVFLTVDDLRVVGMQLLAEKEPAAVLVLFEHSRPLTRSDQDLLLVLSAVLCSMLRSQPEGRTFRSRSTLIADLLRGDLTDPDIIERLDLGQRAPWRLLVVDSPFRTDSISKRSMLERIPRDGIPCIPLYLDPYVVVLVSDVFVEQIIVRIPPEGEGRFWQVAVSLPFSSLLDLRPNFELAVYTMAQTAGTAGIFRCEDYAFSHLLTQIGANLHLKPLLHPALSILKEHDERKSSLLYETLYQYLLHERSIQMGADAMYVHKNSFLYRLQKVRELIQADLEDPMTRAYLLMSFLLDKQ